MRDSELHHSDGHKLNFEELLVEISARFINLPTASINATIKDTQRQICECLNIDLSALWQWSDKGPQYMTVTHLHQPPDGQVQPDEDIDASLTFPWVYQQMLSGKTLAYSSDDMPDEASIDKASRESFGVISSVNIPLRTGGEPVFGVLTFDILHRRYLWSEKEVTRLKLVAELFSNALARKRADRKQAESDARLTLAAESAEAGLWELDYKSRAFWSSEQARKLFNYPPEKIISMENFEQSVHPEDWENVSNVLADSFEKGEKFSIEYRITTGGGDFKWICSKGRPYYYEDNSPQRMLGISQDISERKQLEDQLKRHLLEVEQLKQQLEQENHYLREELITEKGFEHIIGQSKVFKSVLATARQVASTSATVLLLGETGTGKGVIANAIHRMSDRKSCPFITVNCAALPHNLIESELFGRSKGAFTGADVAQAGRFEIANHGTIFLDEIGEMELEMQTKLLRVLQEGEFERLGSSSTIKVDVRVIAATSRNLREEVTKRRFREDLFYRLNVFPITIPPLRQRQDDIPLLAQHFVAKFNRKMGKKIDRIAKSTMDKLKSYAWPGNVRELEHQVERGVIISSNATLTINDQILVDSAVRTDNGLPKDLETNERDHISNVLNLTNWKIEGADGAAAILNMHPSTLRFRLKKLGIHRPG